MEDDAFGRCPAMTAAALIAAGLKLIFGTFPVLRVDRDVEREVGRVQDK